MSAVRSRALTSKVGQGGHRPKSTVSTRPSPHHPRHSTSPMPSSKPFGSLYDAEPREMAVQSPLQELTMAKNDSRFSPSHQIFCNVAWPTLFYHFINTPVAGACARRRANILLQLCMIRTSDQKEQSHYAAPRNDPNLAFKRSPDPPEVSL